jgi:hypothetical protein
MPTNFAVHFVTRIRQNGDKEEEQFITLVEDRPQWLQDAVRDAHQRTLPNDWIYEECRAAVEAFDAGDLRDDDDSVHEHADGRVEIYTKALYQWAADMCLTDTWAEAEQEAKDIGMPEETEKRLACIQYAAIRRIAQMMYAACAEAEKDASSAEPITEGAQS